MSEIEELERRIASALDRLSEAVEALRTTTGAGAAPAALEAELEAERAASAVLRRRVASLKERRDETEARLSQKVERLMERIESQEGQLARMRALNAQLREINAELREGAGLSPDATAGAIDRGMRAELDALRELRAAEAEEIDQILADLRPLVEERSNA